MIYSTEPLDYADWQLQKKKEKKNQQIQFGIQTFPIY